MRWLMKATVLELKLLMRDPVTFVFTLALPVITLYVLGSVFGNTPNARVYRGVGPMNYYVSAYVALTLASIGLIGLPVHLAGYRERGILKRFRASDVPLWSVIGGQLLVAIIAGVLASAIVWIASVVSWHVEFPKQPVLMVAAFVLGAICMGMTGVMLGALMPNARAAQGAGVILWFVMMMLDGAGPPQEVLTETLRMIGGLTPLRHVVILIQDPWLGFGWNTTEMLIVIGFTLAAAAIAFVALRYPSALAFTARRLVRRSAA